MKLHGHLGSSLLALLLGACSANRPAALMQREPPGRTTARAHAQPAPTAEQRSNPRRADLRHTVHGRGPDRDESVS